MLNKDKIGRFVKGHTTNIGNIPSSDTRKKISLGNKGKVRSQEMKIKYSKGHIGKKHSSETIKKISESHKKRVREGKNNFWKGGITPINFLIRQSREYKLWREAVFKRDNYTCVWCGAKGNIQADHIKPFAYYPELRFAIDNGRTLCVPCHKTTDTYLNRWMKK